MLDEPALIVSAQGDGDFTSQVLTSNRHDSILQSLSLGTVVVVCAMFVVIMARRDGGMICRRLRHVLHVLMQVQTDWVQGLEDALDLCHFRERAMCNEQEATHLQSQLRCSSEYRDRRTLRRVRSDRR